MSSRKTIPPPTAFIQPQWLIPARPGQVCRSPRLSLGMMFVYNVVSVAVSTLLASPFFHKPSRKLLDKVWAKAWRLTREKILRGEPLKQEEDSEEVKGFSKLSLYGTIIGSLVISLLGPILTAVILRAQEGERADIKQIGGLIQQWATRPRPTIFLAVIQIVLEFKSWPTAEAREEFGRGEGQQTARSGYFVTVLSAMVNEIVLSAIGMHYLLVQSKTNSDKWFSRDEIEALTECPYSNGCVLKNGRRAPLMQSGARVTFIFIIIGYAFWLIGVFPFILGKMEKGKRVSLVKLYGGVGCWVMTVGLWVLLVYIGSWLLWGGFLTLVPPELYCVERNTMVDVVYCLLPVVLGLWRLICAAKGST